MVKNDLIARSPLRVLDRSAEGGLLPGHIGVIMSQKGVGKTACLVHVAIDQIMQDKNIIHVSFNDSTEHLDNWYRDIFKEMAQKHGMENANEFYNDIIKDRIIITLTPSPSPFSKIQRNVSSVMEATHFKASMLVIEGYNFKSGDPKQFEEFRLFLKQKGLSAWFSVTLEKQESDSFVHEIPESFAKFNDIISIAVILLPKKDHISLRLIKDYNISPIPDIPLELDTRTLLIREKT